MSVQIESISGLIELRDEFTSQINLASLATKAFGDDSSIAFKGVGIAAGLAAAAIAGITAAIVALGSRGADVNDVNATLEDFAGGAQQATDTIAKMREGVLGTVGDFELTQKAAQTLSAGVKLTADQFGSLSRAAFVLQNQGFGDTKTMLDALNDALVTGQTRGIKRLGILVDTGAAEMKYAATLGIEEKNLTEASKAEAHRLAIMEAVEKKVAAAGAQQRDFGEEFEHAQAAIGNWLDELGSAIAASPALTAGIDAFQRAFSEAFGGDSEAAITTIMEYVKSFAILLTNVGLGAIEMARVIHTAWAAVETVVAGALMVIMGDLEALFTGIEKLASVGESLQILPEGSTDQVHQLTGAFGQLRESWAGTMAESAKGLVGTSEFDKTLDKLGGTLYLTRDALEANAASTQKVAETDDFAEANAKKLARATDELKAIQAARAKEEEALWKIEEKSLKETEALWRAHATAVIEASGTSFDAQKSKINDWFDDEVAKLDDSDRNWQQHYDALKQVATDRLKTVGSEWDKLRDQSLESLRQQANAARYYYNPMLTSVYHFSREVLEDQRKKYEDLDMAARGFGDAAKAAHDKPAAAAQKQKDEVEKLAAAEKKAWEEAEARRQAGGSMDVTSQNFQQAVQQLVSTSGGGHATMYHDPYQMASQGYSFAEIAAYAMNPGPLPPPKGPPIPGFGSASQGPSSGYGGSSSPPPNAAASSGGGPSTSYPTVAGAGGGGTAGGVVVHNSIYVNDTLDNAARKVGTEIMRTLK